MPPLEQRLANRQITLMRFGEHAFVLDARGAIFWPSQSLLVVSDLHIGKGSFLQQHANPIPGYDSRDTICRVAQLIDDYTPQNLICLGDSFHDVNAFARLSELDKEQLNTAISRVKNWYWILGNHDPVMPDTLVGQRVAHLDVAGVLFSHDVMKTAQPLVIGHFHPKITLNLEGKRRTGRCFVSTDTTMVMPAFGSYTGGLSCEDAAFNDVLGDALRRYFFMHNGKIWQVSA